MKYKIAILGITLLFLFHVNFCWAQSIIKGNIGINILGGGGESANFFGLGGGYEIATSDKISVGADGELWFNNGLLLYLDLMADYHANTFTEGIYIGGFLGAGFANGTVVDFGGEAGYNIPVAANVLLQLRGRLGLDFISVTYDYYYYTETQTTAGLYFGLNASLAFSF
jgi:hypothetical protein